MRTVLALALVAALAAPATAWEADTTHAGLTEVAALSSRLHARLRALHGRPAGWLELLSMAPDRAPALYKKLGNVEPSSGVVPDRRGRQSALAWLVAGAVVEGIPGDRDRNHFYDPVHRKGLTAPRRGLVATLRGVPSVPGGVAAPDWITAPDNDLGLARFWLELEKSAVAGTRGERDEHLAMALLCAGAMMHVLQDLGAPAHARGDIEEHLLPLGGGPRDRGSRFERLAAWMYGRLGLPEPAAAPPARQRARDFFTAGDGKGLADVTAARWYSMGTLPADVVVPSDPRRGEVAGRVVAAQRFPSPRPTAELRLKGSTGPDGHVLRADDGPCLANYRVDDGRLRFTISDACAAEQLAAILPEVAAYSAGFLEWLFRGALAVSVVSGSVTIAVPPGDVALGAGVLTVLVEDENGRRTVLGGGPVADGGLPEVAAPATATRIIAVFRGQDAAGEELIAVGTSAP
jgi:hypothetical protein